MRCPVCRLQVPPLQEFCLFCQSTWREGQAHCPAVIMGNAVCCLPFRHKELKHKALGVRLETVEATILWHYPDSNPDLSRSVDYREIVG